MRAFNLLLAFCLVYLGASAQTSLRPLERSISLELTGESTKQALNKVELLADVKFAYKTDIVSDSDRLQRSYSNKTVREVLDDLFQGAVMYVEKGNYIILKNAPKPKETEIISDGYVINSLTNEKIAFASVYDSVNLEATISDEYGYYKLKLTKRSNLRLTASKHGYMDTVVLLRSDGGSQNIYLTPLNYTSDVQKESEELEEKVKKVPLIRLNQRQKATVENIKENFTRSAQVSLVPMVGTNGVMSPSTTVDYSFNVIGGLNGGVRVLEIGGIFNTVWDTVQYAQIAGVFNAVGGPQYGAQLAGFANFNGSSFEGAQISGAVNVTTGPFYGFQGTGIGNVTTQNIDGVQLSGIGNYAGDSSDVVQLSGIANYASQHSRGAQVAGIVNVADKNFIGTQVAGISNYSRCGFTGSQVAGIVNIAGHINGTQVGLINMNDSINGVPFGFISFSRKGLHQLEVSGNELTHANIAFKTGTNQFYNSFIGGVRFDANSAPTWGYGYGIGTSVRAGKKNRVFFDFQSVNHIKDGNRGLALNNKLTISYQIQLAPKVALAIGPSANIFVLDTTQGHDVDHFLGMVPYSIIDISFSNGLESRAWVGGHIALRLF